MADELPPPRFRKTKSEKWAVMAPVQTLEAALAGDGKVQVLKKSGDYSTFRVGSLGKPFDVEGVSMCYGYSPEDTESAAERGGPPPTPKSAPAVDPSEPLPEFRGGPEDEWTEGF